MRNVFNHLGNRMAALALGGAVILAGSALAFTQKDKAESAKSVPNVPVDERPIARDAGSHNSFAPLVKKVTPAVVKVLTTTKMHNTSFSSDGNSGPEDLLRRFFGDDFNGNMMPRQGRRNFNMPRQTGLGSGVIVTKDGFILTNNHVVDGADEVKVVMTDGREFTAKVIGRDPKSDVAIIKIDAKDLSAVQMADSDKVEVGDIVLAVGNPFGIGQTVTTGIVSATGRGGAIGLDYEDFIQTDAAINPGNSGGALVDAEGRLIGVNTAILSRTGGNQGVGFAIPANLARSVMDQIIEKGKVERGFLGVKLQDLTPEFAQQFNVPENSSGALIAEVTEKSAAAEAGLKSGDVIIELNGSPVKDGRALQLMVGRLAPGDKVAVKILRDGKEKTMTVTLKEMPEEKLASANHESNEG